MIKELMRKEKTICLSGGFDPVHVGHLRMFNDAAKYGKVILILNSDEWLLNKKGYVFMPWEERAEILRNFQNVHDVVSVDDSDKTVCEALERVKPDYFGNGGDRKPYNTPEKAVCKKHGIDMVWNVGGSYKAQSSSDLVNRIINLMMVDDYL